MTEVLTSRGEALHGAPTCPYKGLGSYTEADKDYFFARESFRDLVAANLIASRLTVLYGPSGVGKSSLLQAGVMPLLRQTAKGAFSYLAVQDAVVVYCDSWRDDPLEVLGEALFRAVPTSVAVSDLRAKHSRLSLELLQEVASRLGAYIYLMLDQFEELLRYHTGTSGEVFDSELGRIAKAPELSVSVLIGVRDDALAQLDRLEPRIPDVLDNKLRLEHLTPSEAQEAIEQPLLRYNTTAPAGREVAIEPELVSELLDQLQAGSVSADEGGEGDTGGSEEIETPYLQLVMTRLWTSENQLGSQILRVQTLEQLGGAKQIVRTYLDTVMAELTEDDREIAASVFNYLVTESGTKVSHRADDLAGYIHNADPAWVREVLERRVREVLERLSSARVVRPVPPPVGSNQPPRYEIFHDVMGPAILNWRRNYVAERDHIARESSLMQEKQEAEQRHQATRRRLRVSRVLSAALALLLVITVISFVKAAQSENRAQQAELLARYGETLRTDPAASLKFALDAWDKLDDSAAEEAVRTAFDANTQRMKVQADKGSLSTSELSPDGQKLLTAGEDGAAKLFDVATGQPLLSFEPAQSAARPELTAASFSPNGAWVLTVSRIGEIRLYDAATGADLGLLCEPGPNAEAAWGTVAGRVVILTSDWKTPARLWDAERRSLLVTYGTQPSDAATLSSDGHHVASLEYVQTTQKYRFSVWDAGSGNLQQRSDYVGYDAQPARFAGTDSGQVVFFAADPDELAWRVLMWDWRKGPSVFRTADGWSRVPAIAAISRNGRLVAAPMDKRVRVFEADTGKLVGETDDAPDWVNAAVAFSPNGRWLATTGNDGRARIWLAEQVNNRPVAELLGHHGGVSDVKFDPRSNWRLATAGEDGTGRIWQLPERAVLSGTGYWMLAAELSPGGEHLLTAEDSGELRLYSPTPGSLGTDQWQQVRRITLRAYGRVIGASFSPDGRTIVAVDEFSFAPSVWDWQLGNEVRILKPWKHLIGRPVVSADGSRIAAGDLNGRVIVWDLHSGEIIAELAGGGEGSNLPELAAVPHSGWFAEGGSDGIVRLWDPDRPEAPQQTLGVKVGSGVEAVEVSPDGASLVSVSGTHQVQVWRLSDGMLVQRFSGPPSTNSDVAFNGDGSLVAISSADGAVHIWRLPDGQKLAVLQRHGDAINSVQFTAGGSLLTASHDSTVAVFPCPSCGSMDKLLETAHERVKTQQR